MSSNSGSFFWRQWLDHLNRPWSTHLTSDHIQVRVSHLIVLLHEVPSLAWKETNCSKARFCGRVVVSIPTCGCDGRSLEAASCSVGKMPCETVCFGELPCETSWTSSSSIWMTCAAVAVAGCSGCGCSSCWGVAAGCSVSSPPCCSRDCVLCSACCETSCSAASGNQACCATDRAGGLGDRDLPLCRFVGVEGANLDVLGGGLKRWYTCVCWYVGLWMLRWWCSCVICWMFVVVCWVGGCEGDSGSWSWFAAGVVGAVRVGTSSSTWIMSSSMASVVGQVQHHLLLTRWWGSEVLDDCSFRKLLLFSCWFPWPSECLPGSRWRRRPCCRSCLASSVELRPRS